MRSVFAFNVVCRNGSDALLVWYASAYKSINTYVTKYILARWEEMIRLGSKRYEAEVSTRGSASYPLYAVLVLEGSVVLVVVFCLRCAHIPIPNSVQVSRFAAVLAQCGGIRGNFPLNNCLFIHSYRTQCGLRKLLTPQQYQKRGAPY